MRVLGDNWGLYGIRGHSLVRVIFFFCGPRLLSFPKGVVKKGWNMDCTVLAYFCHLKGSISPRARGNRRSDGKGVICILSLPKHRWSLNPSLIESFIPHLGAAISTYPRDLSHEGFLGLCHSNVISLMLGLIQSSFCLFPSLLGLLQFLL